jgi:tetratricopeptide (TPR) repeat protein
LAFAKYLISKGDLDSLNPEPISSTCMLNYHDALEFTFDLISTDKDIQTNNLSFMQCFDKINDWLKNNAKSPISLRSSLEKLKDGRVNLKHRGIFPSKVDIEESRIITNKLFEELCKNVYNLNVKDISLIELINYKKVKDFLKKAVDNYPNDQKEAITNLALAFEFLLKDYENSKKDDYYNSPFYFGEEMTFLTSFFMRDEVGGKMAEFVDKTKESIEAMQKAIVILAFGLDYKKYIKFRQNIPKPIWSLGNNLPSVALSSDVKISQQNFDFCVEYIIECALKFQEFDFNIKED